MTSASASRVTRSSRSLRRAVLLFAAVLAGVTVLRAQETPPSTPPGERAVEAGLPADEPVAGDAEAAPTGTPEQPAASVGPTPGRFEPTEKVRADFDVSFPIDI